MPITRPSSDLKDKINVVAVGIRNQEATAEDFQEISAILEEIADQVDALNLVDSSNPYYGRYTSLALLQSAHPTAEVFGWAIIDEGAGISPKIALWNNTGNTWEISGAVTDKVFVANQAALPAPGVENTWYITQDKTELFLWYNSQYNQISGGTTPSNLVAKYLLTQSAPNQKIFKVPGNPNSILLIKNGFPLIEGALLQYTFNILTSEFTLKDESVPEDKFEVVAFGVNAVKQQTIANIANQKDFPIPGNPVVILAFRNGGWLIEGQQFSRTYFSTGNNISLTNGVPIGTLIETITQ